MRESLREYARGIGGGFLFSIPLLYTMEVWWTGFTATPLRLLAGLAGTFLLLCAYNAYAGLRYDSGPAEIVIDSVEELGLGIVLGAAILVLLGRVDVSMAPGEILGKVIIEGMFVAIGVSIGTAQISAAHDEEGSRQGRRNTIGNEIALAWCGAVLVAANIGATEEVQIVAAEAEPWQLLGLVGASLLFSTMLLYYSNFRGADRFASAWHSGSVAEGAIVTYGVALAAAAAILWFFGRFDGVGPLMIAAQCVVLALPAAVGAAAGRLLLR